MLKKVSAVLILAVSLFTAALALAAPGPSANLQALIDGNARFVSGNLTSLPANSGAVVREEVALAQHPFAIVLDCADSRLSPEIIFDQGLGKLFVVRVAGNVLDKHQVASIQYAIEHLHARTVVILGHERCGAVNAAFGSLNDAGLPIGVPADPLATPPVVATGYYALTPELQYLVNTATLKDSVIETKDPVLGVNNATECALINVDKVYAELMLDPLMTDPHLGVEVVKAFYDLDDGVVTFPTTAKGAYWNVRASSSNTAQGTIAPSGDSAVAPGGNQPFVITPAVGYALSEILVDGKPATLPAGNSFVLTNVSSDSTVVASFVNTLPAAQKVEWVGAQTTGVNGAVLVWWAPSNTSGALYNVYKDGVLLQSNVATTNIVTPIQPNGSYVFSVEVVATGFQPSAQVSAAAVTISKSAVAPAWLGVNKGGAGIKLWWPTVATPGATYAIVENGTTPVTYTLQTSGLLSYTILPAKAPGSGAFSYTIQTNASGFTSSGVVPGSATVNY